jgi:RNA polymerase sigma factor (sigma-70 family)
MTSAQAGIVLQHLRRLSGTSRLVQPPDGQLLRQFIIQHDEAAFAALVRRHGPMVLDVCRSVLHHEQDAEDAFQATFLVLAQKAESIRQPEALAGWLYEVAHHVAVKAQANAARRRAQEQRAIPMAATDPTLDMTLRDLRRVLHEELRRLPDKYRLPLVLCYLAGRSQEEAAGQLGWSKGTFRGRLDRGREQLRRRLAARGVALSALLCATALAPKATAKALVDSAVRSAVAGAAAGTLSARAAALAEGVARAMLTGKAKVATAVLLAIGLLAGTGALARFKPAAAGSEPPAAGKAEATKPAAPAATDEEKGDITYAGRVLGPDGKPFAGAKLHLLYFTPKALPVPARATSDAEGRFQFKVARADFERSASATPWESGMVVAVADGYGLGLHEVVRNKPLPRTDLTIRLAKDDAPLHGRVLDLEGKPVAGVKVRVHGLYAPRKGDLTDFVKAVKEKQEIYPALVEGLFGPSGGWVGRDLGSLFAPVKTDADGRFEIKGVGRERLAELRFEAPAIATADVFAMTRPGQTLRLPGYRQYLPRTTILTLHGNGFGHVAAPCKPIVGVVRDKDTGKPIPGAVVTSYERAGDPISAKTDLQTVADREGRFRLLGMPKGEGNVIRAGPPEGQPYLMATKEVADTPGLGPVTVDIQLKRGVWIQGRVIDLVTRRPVHASIEYGAFEDNPYRKEVPGWSVDIYLQTRAADGGFRFVGLPGRGLVAARAYGDQYRLSVGADKIKGLEANGLFRTYPSLIFARTCHALVEVNPTKDAKEVICDIFLDPGRSLKGEVLGPDGKPLTGARASALRSYGYGYWEYEPLKTAEFIVTGLEAGKPRLLQFAHFEKDLAGWLVVKGDEKGPLKVKLVPAGVLTGRLVTPDGQPVKEGQLITRGESLDAPGKAKDKPREGSFPQGIRPGKDGKFRITGLAPGLTYKLGLHRDIYLHELGGAARGELTFKPGETKDLGDVVVKPIE